MKGVVFVRRLLAIMVLLTFGAFPGCGEKEQSESRPASVSKEAYATTRAYTQEQMQAFRKQMETKLNESGDKIDQLQAKAEKLGEDGKAKAEQQLTALRQKRDEVSEKLKDLSSSAGSAWEQVKSGIAEAMEDLENAYKKAEAEFNKS
jgi:DNA-binding transcriptional MerR regulator